MAEFWSIYDVEVSLQPYDQENSKVLPQGNDERRIAGMLQTQKQGLLDVPWENFRLMLDYVCGRFGVSFDPERVTSIMSLTVPEDVKANLRFLGSVITAVFPVKIGPGLKECKHNEAKHFLVIELYVRKAALEAPTAEEIKALF